MVWFELEMFCLRNFDLTKKHLNMDRAYTPKQYAELIVKSTIVQKQLFIVNTQHTVDFKKWWPHSML